MYATSSSLQPSTYSSSLTTCVSSIRTLTGCWRANCTEWVRNTGHVRSLLKQQTNQQKTLYHTFRLRDPGTTDLGSGRAQIPSVLEAHSLNSSTMQLCSLPQTSGRTNFLATNSERLRPLGFEPTPTDIRVPYVRGWYCHNGSLGCSCETNCHV